MEEVGYYSTGPYLMHSCEKVCSILTHISKCLQNESYQTLSISYKLGGTDSKNLVLKCRDLKTDQNVTKDQIYQTLSMLFETLLKKN